LWLKYNPKLCDFKSLTNSRNPSLKHEMEHTQNHLACHLRWFYVIWFMCVDNDNYRCQYGSAQHFFHSMTQIGKRCGIKQLHLILGMQKRVAHWYILPLCCSITKFLIAFIFWMWTPKDNIIFCYECHEPTLLLPNHQWLLDGPPIQALCLCKEPPIKFYDVWCCFHGLVLWIIWINCNSLPFHKQLINHKIM
jgi:hypothetical protein